ncbi:MAG TPA: carbohydrate kinase, partial [Acidobacteriota bacterium]|nr:carbohydrate kinase [Acidobacteriota bacterium]
MNTLIFAGIGEVLFDVFEDGTETVGGAPLNFAVHMHQLAGHFGIGSGTVVSCINADRRGIHVIDALCWRGISTCYIGMDSLHPTGLASVVMKNGEPGYQIEADAAWDYIPDKPAMKELAGKCRAVCFGSLAQRSGQSRATIRNFLRNAPQAIRLYDVNLRQNALSKEPGYSPEIIAYSCMEATVIKANQNELFEMLALLGIDGPEDRATA